MGGGGIAYKKQEIIEYAGVTENTVNTMIELKLLIPSGDYYIINSERVSEYIKQVT